MKLSSLIISITLLIGTFSYAQEATIPAKDLMKQAQGYFEQGQFEKARNTYHQAYAAFVAQEDYKNVVTCGMLLSAAYQRENQYKGAFDMCRAAEYTLVGGEQNEQKKFYDLRFYITQQRLQLYLKLKNLAQANIQLANLEELARQAGSETINEDLLRMKANYYYSFGDSKKGDAYFDQLISPHKEKKEYNKVDLNYKNLIALINESNNVALLDRTYKRFIAWTDTVKNLTEQNDLSALKSKYKEEKLIFQKRERAITSKENLITGLYITVAILIAALILLALLLFRYMSVIQKKKQKIQAVHEKSAQTSQVISHITEQITTTLNTLATKASRCSESETMLEQIKALQLFCKHIRKLSILEGSLNQGYKISSINNINSFCEKSIEKIKPLIKPNVKLSINALKLQVKTNPEQLDYILCYLLTNAAKYTLEGKITLDFKKRGAYMYQFIITDTGSGIPAEKQAELFTPFSSNKDLTQGDGLGLPICALIAKKLNGSLTLDKEYNRGSRFILEIRS